MLVSIATWNCFGMAQGVLDAILAGRAPHSARFRDDEVRGALEGHHVICVQEILSDDAAAFFDRLGKVRIRDANRLRFKPLTLRGSGLGIAGDFAIAESAVHTFGGPRSGWDRFARKGTLHARLNIGGVGGAGGVVVDVLNVHLQSGYDPSAVAIRAAQIAEVGRRVQELGRPERPFIVCGDFNVCGLGGGSPGGGSPGGGSPGGESSGGGSSDYALLRRALPGFDDLGAVDDLPTFDPHPERNSLAHYMEPTSPGQRLDYIFVRAPHFRTQRVVRILDSPLRSTPAPWKMSGAFASDHFALVATIELLP